jgi:hypothetical protein
MMTTTIDSDMQRLLAYEAPFLVEKLLLEHVVETEDEARALFTEVKRYLVAAHANARGEKDCSMYSLVVDEAWHQFVLFTHEYTEFCHSFFGRYIHHIPGNAPEPVNADGEAEAGPEMMTIDEFKAHYEALFGVTLPDVWYDPLNVHLHRRLSRKKKLSVSRGDEGTVDLLDAKGEVLLSVSDMALPALEFVARTPTFFTRELPGNLTDEEKVGLVATLVEYKLLRVAA